MRSAALPLLFLLSTLPMVLATGAHASNDEPRITQTSDLVADGLQASSQGVPIMLEFAAASCEYCELLEQEVRRHAA